MSPLPDFSIFCCFWYPSRHSRGSPTHLVRDILRLFQILVRYVHGSKTFSSSVCRHDLSLSSHPRNPSLSSWVCVSAFCVCVLESCPNRVKAPQPPPTEKVKKVKKKRVSNFRSRRPTCFQRGSTSPVWRKQQTLTFRKTKRRRSKPGNGPRFETVTFTDSRRNNHTGTEDYHQTESGLLGESEGAVWNEELTLARRRRPDLLMCNYCSFTAVFGRCCGESDDICQFDVSVHGCSELLCSETGLLTIASNQVKWNQIQF